MRLPQENKPEGESEQSQPAPAAPQKAPAANSALIKAMNSQTGANTIAALNRAQLTIGGTIAARVAGGTRGFVGGTGGTWGTAGGPGGTGNFGGIKDFGEVSEAKIADKGSFDKIVSTETKVTATYQDGTTKSETTTTKYASGKTVVTENSYTNKGELKSKKVTSYEYDASGKIISETKTTYNTNKEVSETAVTNYEYDTDGKLTYKIRTVCDAAGNKTSETETVYDANGKTVETKKEYRNGEVRTLKETTTNPDGSSVEKSRTNYSENYQDEYIREYDANGIERSCTRTTYFNDRGLVQEYIIEYDEDGKEISRTKKDHMYTYNKEGQVVKECIQESVPAGVVNNIMSYRVTAYTVKEYCYYENGKIKSETVTELDKGNIKSKTVTEYYESGKTKSETTIEYYENEKTKSETTIEYDAEGNKTSETVTKYDANGKPISETKINYGAKEQVTGKTVTGYEYDAAGKKTSETVTEYDASEKPISETKINYGAKEQVTGKTVTGYEYDAAGKKTSETTTEYDANGNKTSETQTINDKYGNIVSKTVTNYEYDTKGNVTKETATEYDINGEVNSKTVTEYEYDTNGNFKSKIEIKSDCFGKVKSKTVTDYAANGQEKNKTVTEYNEYYGNGNVKSETITEYDANGRKTRETYKDYYYNGWIKSEKSIEYNENEHKVSMSYKTYDQYNENKLKNDNFTTYYENGNIKEEILITHDYYGHDLKNIVEHDENGNRTSTKRYWEEQFNSDGELIPSSLTLTSPSGAKIKICVVEHGGNRDKSYDRYELSVDGKEVDPPPSLHTGWMSGVNTNNATKKNICNDRVSSMLDSIVNSLNGLGFDKNKISNAVQKTKAYYQKITNAIIDSGYISRNKDNHKHNQGDGYIEKFGDFEIPLSYHKHEKDCKNLSSENKTNGVSLSQSYNGNDTYRIDFDGAAMLDQFLKFLIA